VRWPAMTEHNLDLAVALDFGGTKVEGALVDANGNVVSGSRFRAPTGGTSSSRQLEAAVTSVLDSVIGFVPAGAVVLGAGIGSAGPIDISQGLVSPLNVPAWRNYPLHKLVEERLQLPTTLSIDGLCITLAEHWVGAARGYANVMGMIVSTGIGGGLILGGITVPGPTGNAGHIGHIAVGGFDDACLCGGRGCVEAIASGPRSVAWANAQGWTGASGEDLAAASSAGDPIAIATIQRAGSAIGQAIASATSLVDLDIVAIGGGFSRVSPALFDSIRAAIAEHAAFDFVSRLRVVPSALGEDGPLIGASALVHQRELLGAAHDESTTARDFAS